MQSTSQPPELPAQVKWTQEELNAYLDRPLQTGGKIFPGTEGMMLRDIEQDIMKGGRFIVHHWCFSIIILSFSRTTSTRYFRSWKSGIGRASFYSLVSMTFGWWGFPFGLLYTPLCLWKNARGGTDVTSDLLSQIIGPARAHSVLSKAAPRKADFLHGLLLFVSFALPVGLFFALVVTVALRR
ncbi:hypothetical protein EI77_00225 [Prosthecobacter fusiformis]|uniref:Uncharacterized protein n=1 Tax=Prosthecobacter fusiformis TaxID=48464 RepID=A0A4R7SPT3_9BACT|nr:hypothetical protein [Prosthecobacter fusiformis]TDU80924.1 hypothetical protein EI77_00225 [Prosthecobacter fusiformis]